MNIDFQQPLVDFRTSAPIPGDDGASVVLADVCVNALMLPEQGANGKQKYKQYELAKAISAKASVDVSAEDISIIKELVGKHYAPAVVGVVWDMLEGR